MPNISRNAKILLSARALTDALLNKTKEKFLHPPINKALEDLAKIFTRAAIPGDPTAEQRVENSEPTTLQNTTKKTL